MITALLENLPGFFDRDPQADLALRIRHPAGLRWQVDTADILTLSPDGLPETAVDLRSLTVGELAASLTSSGFEIPYCNPDLAPRQASILIPGSGDQDCSNGDLLYSFRSILWAHLKAIGGELNTANLALAAMLRQLILPQAQESWADYWGYHFGIVRLTGESDADYTQRIIDEFYRARNNPVAMKKNVQRYTSQDVTLFEPWTKMWTLDQATLSGDDHLPSGYYQYHILHPIGGAEVKWPIVLPVLMADRPAGTILWTPQSLIQHTIAPPITGTMTDGITTGYAATIPVYFDFRLDWLRTSIDQPIRNYPFITSTQESALFQRIPSDQTPAAHVWPARTVRLGEICLSDSGPLGDLNSHFSGGWRWLETGTAPRLDDDAWLSDRVWKRVKAGIDEYFESVVNWQFPAIAPVGIQYAGQQNSLAMGFVSVFYRLEQIYHWSGNWDDRLWSGVTPWFTAYRSIDLVTWTETGEPITLSDSGSLSNYDNALIQITAELPP